MEIRAAYSNFTQGVGKICVVPEYFLGDIRNEYNGQALYVQMIRSGGNLQFTAYRQFSTAADGATNIFPTVTNVYIEGQGISLQVTSDVARVYYGTDLVIAAPHGFTDITNTFPNGGFAHFEFLNATNTTTAAVQMGGIRCRALSAFTVPSE